MLLVLSMTGLAAAATLVDDTTPATLSTFEDLNGNGIDDDCETAVTADAAAATAAMAAVDLDADGVISTTRGGPQRLDRRQELQPRRLRQPVAHDRRRLRRGRAPRDESPGSDTPRSRRARHGAVAADCAEEARRPMRPTTADDAARAACEAALAAGTPLVLPR